ncbi:hypothetical protein X801_06988, partial [Opisthorchis viverrini]
RRYPLFFVDFGLHSVPDNVFPSDVAGVFGITPHSEPLAHVNLSTVAAHYSDIRNHKDANNEPENSLHNELAKLIEGGSTVYTNTEKKQLR